MRTRFTELVGCELPLQLAAMGGVGTTELAAAVAAAGGLGMVPRDAQPAAGACGLNYLMPFVPALDVVEEMARNVRVLEFFYGDPSPSLVAAAHGGGALAGWQVGSVAEAIAASDAGCDFIVAQGTEAGGHVRGTQALDELLPEVLAAVRVPVLAAGGIATAERVRDLLAATGEDTVLTEWFGEGWENAPHRVLRSAETAARKSGWRATTPPYKGIDHPAAVMAMYAGTGVGEVRSMQPAAAVIAELCALL